MRPLGQLIRLGPGGIALLVRERVEGAFQRARERRVVARGSRWPIVSEAERRLESGPPVPRQAADATTDPRLIARADAFCRHEFDLLGSGPVVLDEPIDWSRDFKSGFRWEHRYMGDLTIVDLTDDADVKVPWELSRHQHFVTLGQAYLLTGDEKYAHEFVSQFTQWMDANPPMVGVTWACTMDVALRAVSWAWAWRLFADSPTFGRPERERFLGAILAHGRFIMNHLEWSEVRGNHYLSNGAGLAVIGLVFPQFGESAAWRDKGFEIVWGEVPAQILPDGVDFEMSTSYQRLVLELVLTPTLLARQAGQRVPEEVWHRVERAIEFVMAATRPDGRIALFGDADDGRMQILSEDTRTEVNDHRYLLALGAALFERPDLKAASGGWHRELDWLLTEQDRARYEALPSIPDHGSKAFPAGGFYLLRGGRMWLLADCGPVGLAGLGGHGHNDALSFELSMGEHPVIVDPGTYVYTSDIEAREQLRGTKAHNVVVVDGVEMADLGPDPWSIADQARAEVTAWESGTDRQVLAGRHHGYQRLTSPVSVARRFTLDAGSEELCIEDLLEGEGVHDVEVRFHTLLDVQPVSDGFVLSANGEAVVIVQLDGGGESFVEDAWYSPSYGVRRIASCFGRRWQRIGMPWSATTSFSAAAGEVVV